MTGRPAAWVVAIGGTALAAGEIPGSDAPETVLKMRVTPRVDTASKFGENKITPFLTNVSFDVMAVC